MIGSTSVARRAGSQHASSATNADHATTAFSRWQRAGRLRAGVEPLVAARLVVAVMDGLQVQFLMERDTPDTRVDMPAALRAQIDALLAP